MASMFGIGVVAIIVVTLFLALKADEHYRGLHTKGQQDFIRKVDNSEELSGLELWSYKRGWDKQAVIYGEKS